MQTSPWPVCYSRGTRHPLSRVIWFRWKRLEDRRIRIWIRISLAQVAHIPQDCHSVTIENGFRDWTPRIDLSNDGLKDALPYRRHANHNAGKLLYLLCSCVQRHLWGSRCVCSRMTCSRISLPTPRCAPVRDAVFFRWDDGQGGH